VTLLRGSVIVQGFPVAVYVIPVLRFWLAVTFSVMLVGPAGPCTYVVSDPSGPVLVSMRCCESQVIVVWWFSGSVMRLTLLLAS
jgi:hypothetical protein